MKTPPCALRINEEKQEAAKHSFFPYCSPLLQNAQAIHRGECNEVVARCRAAKMIRVLEHLSPMKKA